MKKLTVITLLMALVAGFAFAGLTTYTKSSAGVQFNGVAKQLSSVDVNGDFKFGAKTDNVDINADVVVSYLDVESNLYKDEKEMQTALNPLYDKVADALIFNPSINFKYTATGLEVNASAAWKNVRNNTEIFGMDAKDFKSAVTVKNTVTLKADAKYAQNIKDSANILKVAGSETIVAEARRDAKSTTSIDATYYVPLAGVVANDTLAAKFTKYTLMAHANAKFVFEEKNATFVKKTVEKSLSADAAYVKYDENDNTIKLTANGSVADKSSAKTIKAGASAVATYSEVKGLNGLDNFEFVATATAGYTKNTDKTLTAGLEFDVTVPRLIPVELIANASYNFPATFTVAYGCVDKNASPNHTLTFAVETHPVYVEFAKEIEVLGKTLKTLDTTIGYENFAEFAGKLLKATKGEMGYTFKAGVALSFDAANFALDFAHIGNEPSLVTMSYKVNY